MIFDQILVRFGDLTLKGKNKKIFLNRLYKLVNTKLEGLNVNIINNYDRIYIELLEENHEVVINALNTVSGLSSYSLVKSCDNNIELIIQEAIKVVASSVTRLTTFKVETKRANKRFSLNSMEVSKIVASGVLKNVENLKVDVHNPELTLHVEIRDNKTYLYTNDKKGIGGFPVGVAGKGLLMISGGIDSPVAGFLAQKQGIQIECIHFESTPLTSIESAQKVIDLTKKMARFAPNNKIKVHMVPFKDLHMQILQNIPESYTITIMRRLMYKIACEYAKKNNLLCLINGESVGQVASQTLQGMLVVNSVVDIPVIRPLATYDKNEIIALARKIDTFNISIKPFEDCCTIYVPKAPATAPSLEKATNFEQKIDISLIEECIRNIKTIDISTTSDLDLSFLGLEVNKVL